MSKAASNSDERSISSPGAVSASPAKTGLSSASTVSRSSANVVASAKPAPAASAAIHSSSRAGAGPGAPPSSASKAASRSRSAAGACGLVSGTAGPAASGARTGGRGAKRVSASAKPAMRASAISGSSLSSAIWSWWESLREYASAMAVILHSHPCGLHRAGPRHATCQRILGKKCPPNHRISAGASTPKSARPDCRTFSTPCTSASLAPVNCRSLTLTKRKASSDPPRFQCPWNWLARSYR